MQLFGPFATSAAISCSGKPYSQTVVTAHGDGTLRSPPVRIDSAGFYTFHETLVGPTNVAQVARPSARETAETSLGAPAIITGRGDHTRSSRSRRLAPDAPAQVQDRRRSESTLRSPLPRST